jgi:hypothetical protein
VRVAVSTVAATAVVTSCATRGHDADEKHAAYAVELFETIPSSMGFTKVEKTASYQERTDADLRCGDFGTHARWCASRVYVGPGDNGDVYLTVLEYENAGEAARYFVNDSPSEYYRRKEGYELLVYGSSGLPSDGVLACETLTSEADPSDKCRSYMWWWRRGRFAILLTDVVRPPLDESERATLLNDVAKYFTDVLPA